MFTGRILEPNEVKQQIIEYYGKTKSIINPNAGVDGRNRSSETTRTDSGRISLESAQAKFDAATTIEEKYKAALEITLAIDEQNNTTTIVAKDNEDFISMLPTKWSEIIRVKDVCGVFFKGKVIINAEKLSSGQELILVYEHEYAHNANSNVHSSDELAELWNNSTEKKRLPKDYLGDADNVKGDELIAHIIEDIIQKQGYENYKNGNIDLSLYSQQEQLKKLELGKSRYEAALEGVKEISFSILAISAMLLAIFIPIANMSGIVGKFFKSFGITIVASVIISYIIAITVIPMISSLLANPKHSKFYLMTESIFLSMDKIYKNLLTKAINFKLTTLLGAFVIFVISIILSSNLGMVFMPKEDRSQFTISIKANANISMDEMKKTTMNIQKDLLSINEVDYSSLTIGLDGNIYESSIYVRLVPIDKRTKNQDEIMEEIREKSKKFRNLEINVNQTDDMNSGAEIMTPFQLILKANDSKLAEESANKLIDYLKSIEGTTNIQNNIQPKKTEISIEILKQNSSKFGVRSSDIAKVIAMAYSGEIAISNFNKNGKEYDIVMRLSDDLRMNKDVINQLNVKNDKGELIALSSLINNNSNTKSIRSVLHIFSISFKSISYSI